MKYKNYQLAQQHVVRQIFAARALLIVENKILLVSEKGDFWHTPGGWCEPLETLHEACQRELYEETGLQTNVKKVIFITESIQDELKQFDNLVHKMNFYCVVEAEGNIDSFNRIMSNWEDPDNQLIKHRRFFDEAEWQNSDRIFSPQELRSLSFQEIQDMKNVYNFVQYKKP